MDIDSGGKYMTLKQTAQYLNLPLPYIYRMSANKQLPGKVSWGRKTVRVDKAKLIDWIDNNGSFNE